MNEHSLPDPTRARASLNAAENSRRAAVTATSRPAGVDLGFAVVSGAGIALAHLGHWPAALFVIAVGGAGVAIIQQRTTRRHGQVLDQRSVGARVWRFAIIYLVLFLLSMNDPPTAWQPWFAVGVGLLAAVGGFAWLRWDARYQGRRLASGDYDRYDLL